MAACSKAQRAQAQVAMILGTKRMLVPLLTAFLMATLLILVTNLLSLQVHSEPSVSVFWNTSLAAYHMP